MVKIRIELDISPDEVPLATELLNTLRSITDQVKLNTVQPASAVVAQPAAPANGGPAVSQAPAMQPPQGFSLAPSPGDQAAAAAYKATMYAILNSFSDDRQLTRVVNELYTLLNNCADKAAAAADLADVFGVVVFNEEFAEVPGRVERYFLLLGGHLPADVNEPFKKAVMQKVIRQLNTPRRTPADVMEQIRHLGPDEKLKLQRDERRPLYVYAQGFAALVKLDIVPLKGAVNVIDKLLAKDTTYSAAFTMVGQLMEFCGSMLATSVPAEAQQQLWSRFDSLTQRADMQALFGYDIEYVNRLRAQHMMQSFPPPQIAGATTVPDQPSPNGYAHEQQREPLPPGTILSLQAMHMLQDADSCYCVNWDKSSCTAITGRKDGSIQFYDTAGNKLHACNPSNQQCSIVSMDVAPEFNALIMAAVPGQGAQGAQAHLALYSTTSPWAPRGTLARPASIATAVRFLAPAQGASQLFVSCESDAAEHAVCLWNMSQFSANGAQSAPVHRYTGHTDLITCVSASPSHPNLFMTGSRDGTVRVWDTRARKQVGWFGVMQQPNMAPAAHTGPVATLDASGNTVVTAGADATVNVYDLRDLSDSNPVAVATMSLAVESPPNIIYKVAYAGSPSPTCAAVSTTSGLFMLDWSAGAAGATMVAATHDERFQPVPACYLDLKWAPYGYMDGSYDCLLAASNDKNYATVFAVAKTQQQAAQ